MFERNPFYSIGPGIGQFITLALVILSAGFLIVGILRLMRPARRKWHPGQKKAPSAAGAAERHKNWPPAVIPTERSMSDPLAQMDAIARVDFETVPLLNKEEARLLPVLEAVIREVGDGFRLMAQTSLGEILKPKEASGDADQRKNAYASINSKRLDFAIFNRYGYLVVAIEYHGSGHYGTNAFMRDAVKGEVLRKARVPRVEIPHDFEPDDVRKRILRILKPPAAPS